MEQYSGTYQMINMKDIGVMTQIQAKKLANEIFHNAPKICRAAIHTGGDVITVTTTAGTIFCATKVSNGWHVQLTRGL